jgi:hypothetical protein
MVNVPVPGTRWPRILIGCRRRPPNVADWSGKIMTNASSVRGARRLANAPGNSRRLIGERHDERRDVVREVNRTSMMSSPPRVADFSDHPEGTDDVRNTYRPAAMSTHLK